MEMVTVRIPTPLRTLTGGRGEVSAEGETIAELLEALEVSYPGFRNRLFDEAGALRRFVNIYLNEDDIRFHDGIATPVKPGDEVSIVPAIAGGRG
jgi:MoaD family protein